MKMNKFQKLLQDLELIMTDEIFKKYFEDIKYKTLQNENKNKLLNKIAEVLLKFTISDDVMKLSYSEKAILNQSIGKEIDSMFIDEFNSESKEIKNTLSKVVYDQYNSRNYCYGISYNLKPVSDDILKGILNMEVLGNKFSDNIWNNKNKLAKDLKNEIDKFLNGKTSVNDISSIISNKYNVNEYCSRRLAVDRIARVQEASNDIWRKDNGIKDVLYCATLDNDTCGKCGNLDGKVYSVDEEKPKIPQHNFCRCTYLDLVSPDWRPKLRFDNESKQIISWTDFNKWKESEE